MLQVFARPFKGGLCILARSVHLHGLYMMGFMLWILRCILVQTAIAASGYEADLFQNGNGDLSWEGSNAPLVAALQQQAADTPSEYKTPAAHGLQGSASSPEDTMKKLRSIYKENVRSKVEMSDHCTGRDIIVRKEWYVSVGEQLVVGADDFQGETWAAMSAWTTCVLSNAWPESLLGRHLTLLLVPERDGTTLFVFHYEPMLAATIAHTR